MEALIDKIQEFINLFQQDGINKLMASIFDESLKNEILDKVKDQMFNKKVADNDEAFGFYSMATERINPEKAFNSPYTYKDTGEYYASLYIDVDEADGCILISSDNPFKEKGGERVNIEELAYEVSGGNILGLTEENINWLRETINPLLNEKISEIL